jgi:hypothetical protein
LADFRRAASTNRQTSADQKDREDKTIKCLDSSAKETGTSYPQGCGAKPLYLLVGQIDVDSIPSGTRCLLVLLTPSVCIGPLAGSGWFNAATHAVNSSRDGGGAVRHASHPAM